MRTLLLTVGAMGVLALAGWGLLSSGSGIGPASGLVPGRLADEADRRPRSPLEAVLTDDLEVRAQPAALRVVSAAPSEEAAVEADVEPPSMGVAFEVKMDSRTRRLGVPLKFGVGCTRPGPLGEAKVDSESLFEGVLESGETFQGRVDVDERATSLWVRTEEPGKAQIKSFRRIRDGKVSLTLQAKTGGTARGTVVTASGVPPTEGRVRLYPEGGSQLGGRLQGDGRFEVHFRGDGDGKLSVDGLEQGATEVELTGLDDGDPPQDLVAELAPGLELGGVVVDGEGRPIPGTRVLVVNERRRKSYESRRARSQSRYLGVEPEGREGDARTTGGDGRFLAEGLEPGDYYVLALTDGARSWERLGGESVAAGGSDYTFTMQARRLRVRVAMPEGGFAEFDPVGSYRAKLEDGVVRPLQERLRVVLHPLEERREGSSHSQRWHATGDPTIWEVSLEANRRYLLQATCLRRPPASLALDFLGDELVREVVLQLPPVQKTGKLRLTLVDPPGAKQVSGYSLSFKAEGGPGLPTLSALERGSSAAGEPHDASLELPAGRYEIRATPQVRSRMGRTEIAPGAAQAWIDVVPGGNHVLTLETLPRAMVKFRFWAPDPGKVEFFGADSGELVRTYLTEGQESRWRGYSLYLDPGEYRIVAEGVSEKFQAQHGQILEANWKVPEATGVGAATTPVWTIESENR